MKKKQEKNSQLQKPSSAFVWSSIVAGLLFYGLLISASKWFPVLTGRIIENEWILVLISAIPMLIVLALFLSNRITELNIAGIGLKFKNELPESLIESVNLDEQLASTFFTKASRSALEQSLKSLAVHSSPPTILIVPIEEANIEFRLLRQYIFRLSDVAPIRYIVFTGSQRRYIGFATFEKFKARFPRLSLETLAYEFQDVRVSNRIPDPFDRESLDAITRYINREVSRQWYGNSFNENDNISVSQLDLEKLGFSDVKVRISTNPTSVYFKLVENDLDGIPVVDRDGKFIGIVTKDKISQAVILQLMQKSEKAESTE